METISSVVNTAKETATKAIWGEQAADNETGGNEPVSGVQGKGSVTDPYDQGNSADPTDPTTGNETAGKEPVSGFQGKGTTTEPFDQGNADDATNPAGKTESVGKPESTGTTSLPIREKSSSSTPAADLTAKPTIPPTDAFNSATAANASTLGHTSAVTSKPETATGIKPLDDTSDLSATGVKLLDETIGTGSTAIKPLDTTPSTDSPAPTTQAADKPALGTETVAGKDTPTKRDVSPKDTSAPIAPTTGSDAAKPSEPKDASAEGLVEDKGAVEKNKDKHTEHSPSGKEKVSKVEKLKEKLHIGHKH